MMAARKGFLVVWLCSIVYAASTMTVTAQQSGAVSTGAVFSGETIAVEYKQQILDDAEFAQAVDRMYANGMTKYKDVTLFRGEEPVTRQQAAKFFSQFSKEVIFSTMDVSKYCRFSDLDQADPSLKNYVLEACLFSLFQGSSGKFFPDAVLTKDQAIAVLMRAINNGFMDEETDPRWRLYYEKAFDFGITKETSLENFSNPLSRYELALLLRRAGVLIQAQ